ncbi:hypothetical protein E3G42_003777 [Mycobacteroides abscessus]|nr:hypothetical protein [Mycobacteroides abscessus]QOF25491.1 hypothetical protein E3G42_003777 [Mycobacteroides abscessus]
MLNDCQRFRFPEVLGRPVTWSCEKPAQLLRMNHLFCIGSLDLKQLADRGQRLQASVRRIEGSVALRFALNGRTDTSAAIQYRWKCRQMAYQGKAYKRRVIYQKQGLIHSSPFNDG